MQVLFYYFLSFTFNYLVNCRNIDYETTKYLEDYGYIEKSKNNSALRTDDYVRNAISKFQEFAGLKITGDVDSETLELMKAPRCGVKDFSRKSRREKRYAIQGSRWKVRNITYKVSKYPRRMERSSTDKDVRDAFNIWAEHTNLKFKQISGKEPVHIDIRFETGNHGDGDPFDGPGGTLAHAYFPVFGGDAHFDDDENWAKTPLRGTHFLQVAAHEFGHSLGLSHSDNRKSLMAPFYKTNQYNIELDNDDIKGIQKLYGKKKFFDNDSDEKTTKKYIPDIDDNSVDGPNLCKDSKIDTIFSTADQRTYVFQDDKYWEIGRAKLLSRKPKLISLRWPGLPDNIDAAFTYANKTFFFKGKLYWKYFNYKMDGDYPQMILNTFKGIPDNIDTAMVWSGNHKIYFFKGTKFWKYDPTRTPHVNDDYPKPISNWYGVDYPLDAAFQHTNRYTYFFKDNAYYRFDDLSFEVDKADPEFPRSTAYWWFGCNDATRGTLSDKSLTTTDKKPTNTRWLFRKLFSDDLSTHTTNSKISKLVGDGTYNSGANA